MQTLAVTNFFSSPSPLGFLLPSEPNTRDPVNGMA